MQTRKYSDEFKIFRLLNIYEILIAIVALVFIIRGIIISEENSLAEYILVVCQVINLFRSFIGIYISLKKRDKQYLDYFNGLNCFYFVFDICLAILVGILLVLLLIVGITFFAFFDDNFGLFIGILCLIEVLLVIDMIINTYYKKIILKMRLWGMARVAQVVPETLRSHFQMQTPGTVPQIMQVQMEPMNDTALQLNQQSFMPYQMGYTQNKPQQMFIPNYLPAEANISYADQQGGYNQNQNYMTRQNEAPTSDSRLPKSNR